MEKKLSSRILRSRLVKIVLALVVLCAVVLQLGPSLVDTKPYVDALASHIRQTTGVTLSVKGGVRAQLLPHPALILHSLELSQPADVSAPNITIDAAEIGVEALSLFSAHPRINAVRLSGVSVVASAGEEKAENKEYFSLPLFKKLAAFKPEYDVEFSVVAGRITTANRTTGETSELSNIDLQGVLGANSQISGSLTAQNIPLRFAASRRGVIGATPIELQVAFDQNNSFSLTGEMDFTADHPLIHGTLKADIADLTRYMKLPKPDTADNSTGVALEEATVPLHLSADYVHKEKELSLKNMAVELLGSKATGAFAWHDDKAHELQLHFDRLDFPGIRALLKRYIAWRDVAAIDSHAPKTLADKSLNVALELDADSIDSDKKSWSKAHLKGTLAAGVLTMDKLQWTVPGDGELTLFGVVSVTDTQGVRFQGSMEAQGKSLRDGLTVFDESALNLPELGFGAYQMHANLFISSELMRLSEADAKFSELALKGGLVAYFDERPRIEAEIGLKNINFDYFRDSWRKTADPKTEGDSFLRFDRGMNFDWLKKLSAVIDLKIVVEDFTFLERKGKDASFQLFAQQDEFGIYNAKFRYNADTTEGSFKLGVEGEQPQINLVLNTADLNTNYFERVPVKMELLKPVVSPPDQAPLSKGALPELALPPALAPEEELRKKIEEEAASMDAVGKETPKEDQDIPQEGTATPAILKPQTWLISNAFAADPTPPTNVNSTDSAAGKRWSEDLLKMNFLEGINSNFDISIGKLQHKQLLFERVKVLAKLENNMINFKTLTFAHWGGSFSINGSIFGGKVPGLSLGFILASVDIKEMLHTLLGIDAIGGRTSISGTIDTSGVNMLSWISQANAKMMVAGRGVTVHQFDVASVVASVSASRTAADVFNNVNLSLVSGNGEYNADGALNLQKGVLSTPGIALKTGRILGNLTGDFRLIPWDMNMTAIFKFPELAPENVPTLTAQWSGAVENMSLQTDTQSLEAFVSKRITGN